MRGGTARGDVVTREQAGSGRNVLGEIDARLPHRAGAHAQGAVGQAGSRPREKLWSTRVTVAYMPKMIQVRNVPEDVHRTLKSRAAAAGMSLSDYIKRDLELAAARPTFEEIDARISDRGRSGVGAATVISALREVRDA